MRGIFIIYSIWYLLALSLMIYVSDIEISASMAKLLFVFSWSSFAFLGLGPMYKVMVYESIDSQKYLWGCFTLFFVRSFIEIMAIYGMRDRWQILALTVFSVMVFLLMYRPLVKIKRSYFDY